MTSGSAVFRRDFERAYPTVDYGRGIYLYDTAGREYLDAASGAVVVNIGYGVDEVVDALAAQARRTPFAYTSQFTSEAHEELAELVIGQAPGMRRAFFVSGGSEAAETAIKLVRQYHLQTARPDKFKVIGRWQSYHGNTLGALALTGRTSFRAAYQPYLAPFPHVSPPHPYRCAYCRPGPSCTLACADELERTIRQEGADSVAAFILEPVGGTSLSGLVSPPGYLARVREVCDRYDVLLVVDEVLTGFGRTGRDFAVQHWDLRPDLMLIGKGITSGYAPLGGVLIGERVLDGFERGARRFDHGFTYAGNPLSCAAGLAVQRYAERHGLTDRAAARGAYLASRLARLSALPMVGEQRGIGMLRGIELVADRDSGTPFERRLRLSERIAALAFRRGLIVLAGVPGTVDGVAGDHLLVAPPLIASEAEIDRAVDELEAVMQEIQVELEPAGSAQEAPVR